MSRLRGRTAAVLLVAACGHTLHPHPQAVAESTGEVHVIANDVSFAQGQHNRTAAAGTSLMRREWEKDKKAATTPAPAPLVNLGGNGCTSSSPCPVCTGDCDDDADCQPGLTCFQRNGKSAVPGCSSGGSGDTNDYDYCYWVPACDETLRGTNGADYRGCQEKTITGRSCQKWTAQTPHTHHFSPMSTYEPKGLGDHAYCRNPSDEASIWCFTTDPLVRWELCVPEVCPTCAAADSGCSAGCVCTYGRASIDTGLCNGLDYTTCTTKYRTLGNGGPDVQKCVMLGSVCVGETPGCPCPCSTHALVSNQFPFLR